MTIIVGCLTKEGSVMASDGFLGSEFIYTDKYKKISEKGRCLFGFSGINLVQTLVSQSITEKILRDPMKFRDFIINTIENSNIEWERNSRGMPKLSDGVIVSGPDFMYELDSVMDPLAIDVGGFTSIGVGGYISVGYCQCWVDSFGKPETLKDARGMLEGAVRASCRWMEGCRGEPQVFESRKKVRKEESCRVYYDIRKPKPWGCT